MVTMFKRFKSEFTFRPLVFFLAGLVLSSCAANIPQEVLDQAYQASIVDARNATSDKISTNLTPIVSYNTNLIWEGVPGQSRVLVVTWASWNGYLNLIGTGPFNTAREIWVTAAPEVKDWIRFHPFELRQYGKVVRLEELLGLPPDNSHQWFVELWANPVDVFRPSPDPEINDKEAEITFPQSAQFVAPTTDYVTWFNNLVGASYDGPNAHPWTRLGYTYDWGFRVPNHIGISEFVVKQGASVEVSGVWTSEEYGN
jgi:hypothetical protein